MAPSERARALVEALHDPCSNEDRWEIVQRHLDEAEATAARELVQQAVHLVRTVAEGQDGSRLTLREQIEEALCGLLSSRQPGPVMTGDPSVGESFSVTIDDEED